MRYGLVMLAVFVALVVAGAGSGFPVGASGAPTYCCVSYVTVANAFDGNASTYWQGAYNQADPSAATPFDVTSWRLIYTYTAAKTITHVTVTYAADARFIATNARVDCSIDGTTWTPIGSIPTGQSSSVTVSASCLAVSVYMEAPTSGMSPAVSEIAITATDAPPPPPPPAPTFSTATSLVAVGDSITAGSYAPNPYTADLPIWKQLTYFNAGVSGNKTGNMVDRFSDVLATGGQIVVIMGGTNDCQFAVPVATIVANLASMVDQAVAANRLPVLVGPIPRTDQHDANGGDHHACLLALRVAISSYAAAHSITFVDPWTTFESPASSGLLDPALTPDGTHPNGRGAFVLARLIAHAFGWGFSSD